MRRTPRAVLAAVLLLPLLVFLTARPAAAVRLSTCTGQSNQRWTLG
jgi:hypothetical protein